MTENQKYPYQMLTLFSGHVGQIGRNEFEEMQISALVSRNMLAYLTHYSSEVMDGL